MTGVTVRFYELDSSHFRKSETKVEQTWGAEKLLKLKETRGWWHPHVQEILEIKGIVGIFWDTGAADGYVEVDPERNNDGHYTLMESVSYCRFVPGDLARAKAEAREKLARYGE